MNKATTFLASGLLCCVLAAMPAHAAPATGKITRNDIVTNFGDDLSVVAEFEAVDNTPYDGLLDLNIKLGFDGYPLNNYVDPSVYVASSQSFGRNNKGPWTVTTSPNSVRRGYTYADSCVLTITLGTPSYKVQLDTNNTTKAY